VKTPSTPHVCISARSAGAFHGIDENLQPAPNAHRQRNAADVAPARVYATARARRALRQRSRVGAPRRQTHAGMRGVASSEQFRRDERTRREILERQPVGGGGSGGGGGCLGIWGLWGGWGWGGGGGAGMLHELRDTLRAKAGAAASLESMLMNAPPVTRARKTSRQQAGGCARPGPASSERELRRGFQRKASRARWRALEFPRRNDHEFAIDKPPRQSRSRAPETSSSRAGARSAAVSPAP